MAEPTIPPLHVVEYALVDLKRWGQLVNYLGSQETEPPQEALYVIGNAIERSAGEALSQYEAGLKTGASREGKPCN